MQITPAAQAAGCISDLQGLSGTSLHFYVGAQEFVARRAPESTIAGVSLSRQYRALKRIANDIGPQPVCYTGDWLIVEWLTGEVKTRIDSLSATSSLLHHLHSQPCFGWRINLIPLLDHYWQQASPARRSVLWHRRLRALKRQGEPKPLRLAPLHMDVHAGNIVHHQKGLRLIDWEYAGDGDIALELAAIFMANNLADDTLLRHYAQISKIALSRLQRQVHRWQPWVIMLMASWYECRWKHTQDKNFLTLADEAWSLLRAMNR